MPETSPRVVALDLAAEILELIENKGVSQLEAQAALVAAQGTLSCCTGLPLIPDALRSECPDPVRSSS